MTMLAPALLLLLAATSAPVPPVAPSAPDAGAGDTRCVSTSERRTYTRDEPDFEAHRAAINQVLAGMEAPPTMRDDLVVPDGSESFAVVLDASTCGPAEAHARVADASCAGDACAAAFPGGAVPEGATLAVHSCGLGRTGRVTRVSTARRVDGRWATHKTESALVEACAPLAP